jgi:hypothetical protein
VTQVFINRAGPSAGSAAGPPSHRSAAAVPLRADYGNSHIAILDRKSLTVLISSARAARSRDFQGPHHIAIDSKGNLCGRSPGNRAQNSCSRDAETPPNALMPAQLTATQ